jgi:hypothetical protein
VASCVGAVCLAGGAVLFWRQQRIAACAPAAFYSRPAVKNLTPLVGLLVGLMLLCCFTSVVPLEQRLRMTVQVAAESTITCPSCGTSKIETMPTDACQFFYDCTGCGTLLRPKPSDCCVFCSFGTVPCPPIQKAGGKRGCCGWP